MFRQSGQRQHLDARRHAGQRPCHLVRIFAPRLIVVGEDDDGRIFEVSGELASPTVRATGASRRHAKLDRGIGPFFAFNNENRTLLGDSFDQFGEAKEDVGRIAESRLPCAAFVVILRKLPFRVVAFLLGERVAELVGVDVSLDKFPVALGFGFAVEAAFLVIEKPFASQFVLYVPPIATGVAVDDWLAVLAVADRERGIFVGVLGAAGLACSFRASGL